MKRFGLFGLILVVSVLGACNDNDGGSGFGLPRGQIGEVRITIGMPSTCDGGDNDGGNCSPSSDCDDAFCSSLCIDDVPRTLCDTSADCIDSACMLICDRGPDDGTACDPEADCPDGTCTTALIQDVNYVYNPSDLGADVKSTDTDGDGDGFTPAIALESAALGSQGEICVDFLDDVVDCINITWGPQQIQVFQTCRDPIGDIGGAGLVEPEDCITPVTFTFPE